MSLLRDALEASAQATSLNPASLSSAALRATCVVNVLVEESSLFGSKGVQQGDSSGNRLDDGRCQRIKAEFREALAACNLALASKAPTFIEPVISLSDGNSQTCDPCCLVGLHHSYQIRLGALLVGALHPTRMYGTNPPMSPPMSPQRVQDQILLWCKEERWDRIAAEKRSVLGCMSQVLESCYTLLDSTQIPVDGIVRLLQHILRPQQQELQMWASQLLLGAEAVHGLGLGCLWCCTCVGGSRDSLMKVVGGIHWYRPFPKLLPLQVRA